MASGMDQAPEESNRDEALFAIALKQPATERAAFLNAVCLGDPALRQRLDVLLSAHDVPATMPESPTASSEHPTAGLEFKGEEGPGARIGHYKLLQKIGEGGMGVVYMAEQEEPVRRRVALKIIKLGMDTRQVVARFEAERQALAIMDHANIAKVLDGGATETGRPYFVMELVQGVPITEYCDKNKLPAKERLKLFVQVCQAIQSAHQKAIIHRDIKPSNVLVTLHNGEPTPKVIDFGIAKATSQKLTEKTLFTNFGAMIGTPAYMSPEQAEMRGMDIDTRSDIYSLGVLLYELLTGSTPFPEKRLRSLAYGEMQRVIMQEEPERPSTRLSTMGDEEKTALVKSYGGDRRALSHLLKGDLDWVVMKCLEKDRTRRYETANGLGADIQRQMNNEPVVARPPSAIYRFQKAFRRNKLLFTAGLVVALSLVAGLSIAALGWRETLVEKDKAIQAKAGEEAQRKAAQEQKAELAHLLYVANMNVAQQAWDQNNIGRLRQLLKDTATDPERGFEWYYWQRQTHFEIQTLRGHSRVVSSVAFSTDGRRIVTGSWDKTAKVWDAATGRELLTLTGHSNAIWSVAFSRDDQRIVTGSEDQTARVWDAATGHELFTLTGHSNTICSVAFSPDSQRIATGGADQTAKVWDAATGHELFSLTGHSKEIFSLVFSPDGRRIVTGGADQTARVWDAVKGKELLVFGGHHREVNSVAFSPDGRLIASGSSDALAKIWEATSGKEILSLKGHGLGVNAVAFSPDGRLIVTGSDDQTARVWNSESGEELFALKGHGSMICSVAFSPDGRRIVTSSGDWMDITEHTAKLWGGSREPEVITLDGHGREVSSVGFSPDGRRIVTGSADGKARVWDTASGTNLLTLKGHGDQVLAVCFSPDGKRIVTGSWDKTAKVWDAASGHEMFTLAGHSNAILSVAFSSDSQRIVTGSWDKTAKIWDAASGKELLALDGRNGRVWHVAYSPEGRRIVVTSDQSAKVWDASSGKELLTLKGHDSLMYCAAFSQDGNRIVTGSADRTAKVWDAASGKALLRLSGHGDQVMAVCFSPDGKRILTGSRDRTAKLWDAASGKEMLTLKGHGEAVHAVAFSPDSLRIVTGSWDNTAKVWESATLQQVVAWQAEERAADQSLSAVSRLKEESPRVARDHEEEAAKR
jgi:WD40 repeat protein/serine/threonine protein kinase